MCLCTISIVIGILVFVLILILILNSSNKTVIVNNTDYYNQRKCPHCGRYIPPDAVLCPYCGKKF